MLLRELYHRTKNNMQVIHSMLVLEAAQRKNTGISDFAREITQKIKAMALVHQMLYRSQDLSRVDLREYFSELATLLMQSFKVSPGKISLVIDLEPVSASIDIATPCALIVNELMSNALKYAFPGDMTGEISLQLRKTGDTMLELVFSDNGVGLPPGFDFRGQQSLGMQSIFALAEHQLQGEVYFEARRGLTCQIRFAETSKIPGV
ncbi:MAG: sensor histidine kinase [Candidatus Eremiobacteraeota bacterium]|nr:sensor histidine kinase [Candidatus Eremiobacteraeota bacterium]